MIKLRVLLGSHVTCENLIRPHDLNLKRLFVDVDVVSPFNLFGFAEQDEVLKQEDVPEVLPASAPHYELILTPQLALFFQIHLQTKARRKSL